MKTIRLKPILDKGTYSKEVEKIIKYELYRKIFAPLLSILGVSKAQMARKAPKGRKTNESLSSLEKALREGLIAYSNDYLTGKFTAEISKEIKALGGTWSQIRKAFRIEQHLLPVRIKQAIIIGRETVHKTVKDINAKLDEVLENGIEDIDFTPQFEQMMSDLEKQYKASTNTREVRAKDLEIGMSMSGFIEAGLKEKYNENLNLYIKEWADEQIIRLRGRVEENAAQGFRATRMIEQIQAEYGVTENKAKFLARQETSLLVSKYREETYKEAGVGEYVWSTSQDSRVRGDHKDLNGRTFAWDSPPIVDTATGRKANPGEDFGCRCVAIPVVRVRT